MRLWAGRQAGWGGRRRKLANRRVDHQGDSDMGGNDGRRKHPEAMRWAERTRKGLE